MEDEMLTVDLIFTPQFTLRISVPPIRGAGLIEV